MRPLDSTIPYGYCHCGCGQKTTVIDRNCAARGLVRGEPRMYLPFHFNRRATPDYLAEDRGYVTPCWVWQGSLNDRGYGRHGSHKMGTRMAHRVYYEKANGPIEEGMVIDHLCRVRCCVNPDHMEVVTNIVNIHRGDRTILTPETVIAIRQCRDLTFSQMAERFGMTTNGIKQVYYGYCWKSVPFDPPPPRKKGRAFSRQESLE